MSAAKRFQNRRNKRQYLTDGRRQKYWHTFRQELMKQRDEGKVTEEEFSQAFDRVSDPKTADAVIRQSGQELGAIDWDSIVTWFKENWFEILKIILTIALFLEPKPEDQEEPASD